MLGETADAVADYGSKKAAAAAAVVSESASSTNGAAGESTTLRRESEGGGRRRSCMRSAVTITHSHKPFLLLAAKLKGLKGERSRKI